MSSGDASLFLTWDRLGILLSHALVKVLSAGMACPLIMKAANRKATDECTAEGVCGLSYASCEHAADATRSAQDGALGISASCREISSIPAGSRVALRVLEVSQLVVALDASGASLDALAAARAARPKLAFICAARPLFFTWTPDGRRIVAVGPCCCRMLALWHAQLREIYCT